MKITINTVALILIMVIYGCGKKNESLAKKAGSKIGSTLTDFTTGIGKGIDKQMKVKVELSDELKGLGISKTIAKSMGLDKKGITVYLLSKDEMKIKLIAKAFNADNLEIGRSVVEANFQADDAQYIEFEFNENLDRSMVRKYIIDKKRINSNKGVSANLDTADAESK